MMDRIRTATAVFIKIALVWLIVLLLIRLFEIVWNGFTHQFPPALPGFILWSILADLIFWFKWLFVGYLIFLPILLFYQKLGRILLEVFIVLMTVLYLGLVQYFHTSLVPLGADVYGYSMEDIAQTVGASGGISIFSVLSMIVVIALIVYLFRLLPGKIRLPMPLIFTLLLFSLLFLVTGASRQIHLKVYPSDFFNNLLLNKADHFFKSSYLHFYPEDEEVDIYADAYIGDYQDTAPGRQAVHRYIGGKEYPFYRELENEDVLSPYFKPSPTKPNIVIILVEGLGRAFTNDGAYLGNFTPFIDSLAGKSLYWKNFLSAGGRTFAVLPSLMASLPFATNGFLELGSKMPDHLSLYSLLKSNGYRTSFYYGGNASFDNMSLFLKKNRVDDIKDQASFPGGYDKLPAVNGFSWGYSDEALFRYFLSSRGDDGVSKSPELSVVLTVATHNPFRINDQDTYVKRFEKRMNELGFDDSKKDDYRNYQLQYSSIMYTDDVLRGFFDTYKKRADFGNTIFLITGDHRMPEIPMSSKIDRYHVPLIIYSPLLKRTAQFASLSTHFDIAPSLLAYLHKSYGIDIPRQGSWMGDGLDTARNFRNLRSYPLIQTKTDIVDFVMDQYHLNSGMLYELGANMEERQITHPGMYEKVKNAFENFKRRNSGLVKGGKILPDSVLRRYLK